MGPPPLLSPDQDLSTLLTLALLQGVSEFLPISSDGHLVLAQHFMGVAGPQLAIDVALHLGTLAAVVAVFWRPLVEVLAQAWRGERRELFLLFLGSLPAAIVGLALRKEIEPLFGSGRAAALGLLGTAVFLFLGERARRRSVAEAQSGRALGWADALLIGSAQALAILPGVSRSGTTIATAVARGVDAGQAARFSFLLSVPAVGGAVLLEVPELVRAGGFGTELALAVLASFVVGVFALRFLLAFLGRGAFGWCAAYCLALGTTALLWIG